MSKPETRQHLMQRLEKIRVQRDELLVVLKKVNATPLDSWYSSGLNFEVTSLITQVEKQL